jgi:SAM-dependent methyltransferase
VNSEEVLQEWADRSGEYSPDYYAYYGPNETSEQLRARLDALVGTDAALLELGCSSGRHLAHLHDHGYDEIRGVDINDEAFDVMADAYPDLFAAGTFHADAIESAVREFSDGQFDAVYSVETLQHIHPDNDWVFDEIARITDDLVVTVENEGGQNSGDADEERDTEEREADEKREADEERDAGEEYDADEDYDANGSHDMDGGTDADAERGVNYVNDEFPLYYRDWQQVFTERGFEEVAVESLDRDTLRTFRLASDRSPNRRNPN